MAITVKRGKHVHWIDAEGLLVPLKHISEKDQKRDALVEKVVNKAIDLQETISREKQEMRELIYAHLDEVAERIGAHISTVYRMINDIEDPLKAFRLRGRSLRINGAGRLK